MPKRSLYWIERGATLVAVLSLGFSAAAYGAPWLLGEFESEWAPSRLGRHQRAVQEPMRGTAQGILTSSDQRIRALILEGTGKWALSRGVGWIEGTAPIDAARGNIGLAGHRDGFFRSLRHVRVGDRFTIEAPGLRRIFVGEQTEIVQPEDVHVLSGTHDAVLTLVTCYPFYWVGSAPQRFIVRSREVAEAAR